MQRTAPTLAGPKVVGKIDTAIPTTLRKSSSDSAPPATAPSVEGPEKGADKKPPEERTEHVLRARPIQLAGPKILDKIELKEPIRPTKEAENKKKRPRKRIAGPAGSGTAEDANKRGGRTAVKELDQKEVSENIKATLAKLSQGQSSVTPARGRIRKERRTARIKQHEAQEAAEKQRGKVLQTTEFASVSDLAALMNVDVNDLISTCMQMGMLVSINQRLDSEEISILADEYGYEVEFTTTEEEETGIEDISDTWPDDTSRAPIVTIMGHVDHGKTSLLDFIRKTRLVATEAGGITQHIGAYEVMCGERKIVFLDTPGHAAFTAMRARGARLTDVAVLVVAADDQVMPQTEEAINHVKVAGVPFLIAINKVDKEGAKPERIREQLSEKKVLVEEWGGKVQSQEISAKTGEGIDELLDKLLLESDLLELKANPKKRASGSVIEASLDKGRGYVANLLVQNGTLQVGDVVLSGKHTGKVKALFDHLGNRIKQATPATPVQLLGLDGPPQAGEKFVVMHDEREAKEIANKRQQIARQHSIRTKKHITLDEIGRRLAIGSFKELNLLIKGDVDGSVEALADALLKLSTDEVQVKIIHQGVGQISESDVLLATAADAIIIGFQVRPSDSAKTLAEKEQIEIRLYSVIFETIDELSDAIKGMHEPKFEESITATLMVKQVFKISKVGSIAGCAVKTGTLRKSNAVRLIRDGIVVYDGEMAQLKHFKDEVSEVKQGSECGIGLKNCNDLHEGDTIEAYTRKEINL